jgi:mannosyltransferase OCH1-like enzyme
MNSTVVVPRIIHNTWKTADIPPEWQYAREQCMKAHPGYEFMLWTDESARAMVAEVSFLRYHASGMHVTNGCASCPKTRGRQLLPPPAAFVVSQQF